MNTDITKRTLETIIGKNYSLKSIEMLQEALSAALGQQKNESTYAAAAVCILYLSYYKLRFPANKLRTFYTNIKEEINLPLFDCKAYNSILSAIEEKRLEECELIDEKYNIIRTTITKSEIFEALDFYTNQ